ncbi:Hypothetical predicted protein [Pelobates cultripes]|uniref:Uncharacterized protein n=1 Tax=Pelobates cultripes TaxID=61616 RepID=A0AAD1VTG5_PELCU|nr:Hypothetical predicted protein [Pelobates cultripes]
MSHHKGKRASEKQDKLHFFGAKQGQAKGALLLEDSQDGIDTDGEQAVNPDPTGLILTTDGLQAMFDSMTSKLQDTLQWSFTDLRTDIQQLGTRTSELESNMEAHVEVHNRLTARVGKVWDEINDYEAKLAVMEDRAHRTMTLRKRITFNIITNLLRSNNIAYRWGYPTKLLVQRNRALSAICTPEDGLQKLKDWGLNTPAQQPEAAGRLPHVRKKALK